MRKPRPNLALLTDLYQLTMAYAYWKSGTHKKDAVFNLSFRKNPFNGGFAVACGLAQVVEVLENFAFDGSDLAYLAQLEGSNGKALFERAFLQYLSQLEFSCDVDAIPEGTVVFPHEPLVQVQGPIIQSQILETILLNLINFQTLIATKAARICLATRGEPVLEFGLRRAHGIDGALTASRAAYVGGCVGTSNVLAGKIYGIPVKGTHAHSWVMSFDTELEALQAYAEAMPNNCVLLVDTYDTLEGVKRAIEIGGWLRARGSDLAGIRLDSGDLAYLSIEARKLLDAAGFAKTVIAASNNLDEQIITSLKEQGATISVWGVGTKLVTAYDQPALGGVYKLAAVRNPGESWKYKVKLSEQTIKMSNPGIQQVRRYSSGSEYVADVIYDVEKPISGECTMIDPVDITRQKHLMADTAYEELLVPVMRQGKVVYQAPPLGQTRERTQAQLAHFHGGIKRFVNPHQYPVGLEAGLHQLKTNLVWKARGIVQ